MQIVAQCSIGASEVQRHFQSTNANFCEVSLLLHVETPTKNVIHPAQDSKQHHTMGPELTTASKEQNNNKQSHCKPSS